MKISIHVFYKIIANPLLFTSPEGGSMVNWIGHWTCTHHLLVLFHCSPELNSSKSQPVCLLSVGILKVIPSTEIEVAIDLKLCKVVVNVSNFKEMQYSEDLTLSKTYVRDMYICLIVSKKCMPTKSHYEYWCLKI